MMVNYRSVNKAIVSLLILLITAVGYSQQYGTYRYMPFQIGFVPPLTTNGVDFAYTVNKASVNLLIGVAAGCDGLEVGGLMNIDHDFVKGIQFAGFGNINGGELQGIQGAGFANYSADSVIGIQGAGIANFSGNIDGVQGAGFMNIANGDANAIQGAGFMNLAAGNLTGVQGAGFLNVAKSVKGVQGSGFANIAENVEGVQATGFLNVARNVTGSQLGVVNICDSISGIPIGVFSLVRKNGYRAFDVWVDETVLVNVGYVLGVQRFYNKYSLGFKPGRYNVWGYGVGAGAFFNLAPSKQLSIDLMTEHLKEGFKWNNQQNLRVQVGLNFHQQVNEQMSIYAGPAYNVLYSWNYDNQINHVAPGWARQSVSFGNEKVYHWFGFNAGIRF